MRRLEGERGVGYMMTAPITLPPLNLTPAPESPAGASLNAGKQGAGLGGLGTGLGLGGFGSGAANAATAIDTMATAPETPEPVTDKPFITPPPWPSITGIACLQPSIGPRRLTPIVRSQTSTSRSTRAAPLFSLGASRLPST